MCLYRILVWPDSCFLYISFFARIDSRIDCPPGRKAAEAQAKATAMKAQLAAQAADAPVAANGRRAPSRISPSSNATQSVPTSGTGAEMRPNHVESICFMSYEQQPPKKSSLSQQFHQQEKEDITKKLMSAHFAHALAQVFAGGSLGEAVFSSKVGFALDKLFRSFGRSKPGRGMLNFPEFTGALRHVVSQHNMDTRYAETDVVADVFMFCDGNGNGYVSDFELRNFLLDHWRARRSTMRLKSQVARRKQAPRFRGPPPRRGQRLPRVRMGPKRRFKIAPGLGLNRGVRSGGVRGRRRRKPLVRDAGHGVSNRYWIQQRNAARHQARTKIASVNALHMQCAPMARRLLAAQTLQGWANAFCQYDRTRARSMQWREVRDHFTTSFRSGCSVGCNDTVGDLASLAALDD